MVLKDLLTSFDFKQIQKEPCRLLFGLGLSLSRNTYHQGLLNIIICIHYLVVSSPRAVRPTTSIECRFIDVRVNVKNYQDNNFNISKCTSELLS